MSLHFLAILVAILSLGPGALYLLRRGRDPFAPPRFIGGCAFVIADRKLLTNPQPALNHLPASFYHEYLWIVFFSLASLYAGWYWWKRRHRSAILLPSQLKVPAQAGWLSAYRREFRPERLLAAGLGFAFLAFLSLVITHGHKHATGYVRDLSFLSVPAVIFLIQAMMLDTSYALPAIFGIALALSRYVLRFFSYGGRGDTARIATLLLVPYLFRGTRPRKLPLVILAVSLAIGLIALAKSRKILSQGEAPNRIEAVAAAVKQMFSGEHRKYSLGQEFVIGAAEVYSVQKLHNWDYGRFAWNVLATFPPHQFFPHKIQWQTTWGEGPRGYLNTIRNATGLPFLTGAAPTGFADAFVEFWWLFPIFWFLLGYWLHHVYAGAVYEKRLDYQGYLAILFVVLLYLVAQGFYPASFNFLFSILPAMIAYRWCRVVRHPAGARERFSGVAT